MNFGFRRLRGVSRLTAFTLVEMLIVIVIIGTLSMAILPKLTGVMASARDLKRHMDLRSLATAIQAYSNANGSLPLRKTEDTSHIKDQYSIYFGSASELAEALGPYLSEIPRDPQRSNTIKIHAWHHFTPTGWSVHWRGAFWGGGYVLRPGEYLYQIVRRDGMVHGGAVLVAKVETPGKANLVVNPSRVFNRNYRQHAEDQHYTEGGLWQEYGDRGGWKYSHLDYDKFNFCETIKRGTEIITANENNKDCVYTQTSQLYYVLKI